MGTTTMGVKLDDATRERIKSAATRIDRTPHWLIKQAIFSYLEQLENSDTLPELPALLSGAANESDEAPTPAEEPHQPFLDFAEQILPQSVSRAAITAAYRRPETEAVSMLLEQARLPQPVAAQAHKLAYQLADKLRNQKNASGRAGMVQGLLQEFSLSSQEGVALMCLAEALLRIPDKATRDALIRDKISNGNWQSHIGRSPSLFVNAATWGLLFTGKLVSTHNEAILSRSLNRIIGKSGEPLIRKGVDMAMRLMGEPLYEQVTGKVADGKLNRPCRIYAPVGTHETLLAYLARRLLENGANTSFVNRIADTSLPLDELVADPVTAVEKLAQQEGQTGLPHPKIPLPRDLYGHGRDNSAGLDLANEHRLASLSSALLNSALQKWQALPMLEQPVAAGEMSPVINPAEPKDIVGFVREATPREVEQALESAVNNAPIWFATPPVERAAILHRAAVLMESQMQQLIGILVREAGKTFSNAIAEVREAVDFLHYYAGQVRDDFANETHRPLGPVVCISPWNFPLAIFTGQIAAALAAGNSVLAKPAEQTPLIAAQGIAILLEAGVPPGVVQLLPGQGETVGAQLTGDDRVRGVMFTGSTEVATLLQRNIASRLDAQGRPIPLIAETGGMNAMIVDSSALTEQVVVDVLASAFDSAGQRCSALRVLCLQDEIADHTLKMLRGAMAECRMGNPGRLTTDIGPVIDSEAKANIERHIQTMRSKGRPVFQAVRENSEDAREWQSGTFVAPTLIELDDFAELQKEVFGPVLHVVRYNRNQLPELIEQINASGYGLTLGVHTRIDETIAQVTGSAHVGNLYVNRNMVGAVVGVQPFGGEGLSGTGPKAGGPLYLYRLLANRPESALAVTLARQDAEYPVDAQLKAALTQPLNALREWAANRPELQALCTQYGELAQAGTQRLLPGPTGERNTWTLLPRERVLCIADDEQDALTQLAAVLAVGSQVLWPDDALHRQLVKALPSAVSERIQLAKAENITAQPFDAVIFHGDSDQLRALCEAVAARDGAIVSVQGFARGESNILLERLYIERSLSVNTAAAGGNASLMTIG
ncbi:bifunctional proline dehydrogenase/L-glutamate gamma-semialdehyde dehydrogenase PutA [Escherichia coli]|nr:bifunctional proline dehydrogenase/L-glutamate gamma-semialdehyde dehydrogenase PutA [Escherichia coli]